MSINCINCSNRKWKENWVKLGRTIGQAAIKTLLSEIESIKHEIDNISALLKCVYSTPDQFHFFFSSTSSASYGSLYRALYTIFTTSFTAPYYISNIFFLFCYLVSNLWHITESKYIYHGPFINFIFPSAKCDWMIKYLFLQSQSDQYKQIKLHCNINRK